MTKELWIVIPNPQAMLFLNRLLALRKHYRERDVPVEFYVIDIEKEELVPITRLAEIAREIERSLGARWRGI